MNPPILETKVYRALWNGDDDEVIKLCKETPEGPFLRCSIYKSTVFHRAIYFKRFKLANELLDTLPENLVSKLNDQSNDMKNTILHNTATTSNKGLEFARKLLRKAPGLLHVRNKWGETAVFQACRYGKLETFKFLAMEVDKFCKLHQDYDHLHFFQRDDQTTILQMAILTRNFDLALMIAENYPNLCQVKPAKNEMSPLQILASSPKDFRSGVKLGFLKEIVYSSVDPDMEDEREQKAGIIQKVVSLILGMHCKLYYTLPMLETVKEMKRSHKTAEKLAEVLARSDTTWLNPPTRDPEVTPHINGADSVSDDKAEYDDDLEMGTRSNRSSSSVPDAEEIPLILAAKYGCLEIVKEILDQYPQAVEYQNYEQQTLLHVAIRNRKFEIFKLVRPEISPIRGSLRAIDVKGNSILHMVGILKETAPDKSKLKSPVIRLSEDLLLLKYLKNMSPRCLINHRNRDMMTADELFARNNEKLRSEAKEWLKRTAEHCTVVIVLIATVAFAAAYTIPGGPDSKTGYPMLLSKPFFLVFTMADVLSLGFALTAVVIFLAILTSSFQMKEFRRSLPEKLLLGFTLLFLSVSMMMMAFAATIILMINNKEHWSKIGVSVVAFFPVCVFMLSYIPLYIKLAKSLRYWVVKIGKSFPRIRCASMS